MFLKNKGHNIFLGTSRKEMLDQASDEFNVIFTNWKSKKSLINICSNVDVIIHAFGMNAKDCELDPIKAVKVNGLYTQKLMSAAIDMKVKKFIYLSTAHVYCAPLIGEINEYNLLKNSHPYATSHVVGEKSVLSMSFENEIQGYVLRLANAFGAPILKKTNCWYLVIQDFCRQIIEKEKILINSNSSIERNFIPIYSICEIIEQIINIENASYKNLIINVGSKVSKSLKEIADLISERYKILTGLDIQVVTSEQKRELIGLYHLKYSSKNIKNLNIKLKENFEREIDDLIFYCKKHFKKQIT